MPKPHGIHRQFHAAPGRHDHHGQGIVTTAHLLEQLETFLPRSGVAGVIQVHQQQVPGTSAQLIEDSDRCGDELQRVVVLRQKKAKRLENVGLIVGNQNPRTRIPRTMRIQAPSLATLTYYTPRQRVSDFDRLEEQTGTGQ